MIMAESRIGIVSFLSKGKRLLVDVSMRFDLTTEFSKPFLGIYGRAALLRRRGRNRPKGQRGFQDSLMFGFAEWRDHHVDRLRSPVLLLAICDGTGLWFWLLTEVPDGEDKQHGGDRIELQHNCGVPLMQ